MLEFIKSKFSNTEETTHLLAARSLDQVKDEGDLDKYKLVYWVSERRTKAYIRERTTERLCGVDLLYIWYRHAIAVEW